MTRSPTVGNTRRRALAGCIVTFVNVDTGEERVHHEPGYYLESLRPSLTPSTAARRRRVDTQNVWASLKAAVAEADRWAGDWRVRTISTPDTIYRDLRSRGTANHDGRARVPEPPEIAMLARIGRPDMWWRA